MTLREAQAAHRSAVEKAGVDYESELGRMLRAAFLGGWLAAGGSTEGVGNEGGRERE